MQPGKRKLCHMRMERHTSCQKTFSAIANTGNTTAPASTSCHVGVCCTQKGKRGPSCVKTLFEAVAFILYHLRSCTLGYLSVEKSRIVIV